MKRWIILFSGVLLAFSLRAQQHRLSGAVTDAGDNSPLPGSTVIVTQPGEDHTGQGTVTDERGRFFFTVKDGTYNLRISFVGFKTYTAEITIAGTDKDMGVIPLLQDVTRLGEVKVEEKAPMAVQMGDTTQYNADAFKVNPDANAENLIEKMPGVVVQDGKLQAQGEEVKKVLVDGKPFFGEDPNAALKNIPAEIIDKIQIFDEKSEPARFTGFDDGQTTKTVNIITKLEYRNGKFGRVYGGYGTNDRYSAGGVINFFDDDQKISVLGQTNNVNQQNFSQEDLVGVMSSSGRRGGFRGGPPPGGGPPRGGGGNPSGGRAGGDAADFMVGSQSGISQTHAAGINYTDKWGEKTNVTGSYFFNNTHNEAGTALHRDYLLTEDAGQLYNESEISGSDDYNHRFNVRMDYEIDDNNSILLRPRFSFQQNDGVSLTEAVTSQNGLSLNQAFTDFSSDLAGWNFGNEILYRHIFKKEGRTLSLRLDQNFNDNNGSSDLYSEYFSLNGSLSDTADQYSGSDKYERAFGGNLMYTEPLAENYQLMISGGSGYSFNDSDRKTWNPDDITGSYTIVDTLLSNEFRSDYTTHEGGAGIRYNKKKINFMVRMAYEYAELKTEQILPEEGNLRRTYNNLLPMAMFMYRPSRSENLRIFYRTSTSAPTIDQLQDVPDNSNPLQITTGNPELKQQLRNMLFLRYSKTDTGKGRVFFAMIRGTLTHNYIGNQTLTSVKDTVLPNGIPWTNGAQLIQPVNLNGYYNLNSFITYGFPVVRLKSNLNVSLSAGYSRIPGIIGTGTNYAHTPSWGMLAALSSNISDKLDFTLSSNSQFSYSSNTLGSQLNSSYFNQQSKVRLFWNFWQGMVFRTDMSHQFYTGLSEGYNENFWLWNLGLGYKFMKNRQAEINVSLYDVLDQNKSISRSVTDSYVEDSRTETLQRYLMVSFTYNIRMFRGNDG
ncbi:MAG: TonB-dependent receptor [Bacteroidales bacterium]|nr:TonB-dependent receptor [Bacteroidales bacterium]